MFPPSSSMFEARMSRLKVSAARALAIAAVEFEEDSSCIAAAEVEEVSIRSVWERYFER